MIVIGSGMAGYQFIKEYRKLNSKQSILLITKDDGRVYNKTQLSTAFAKNQTAEGLTNFSAAEMADKMNFNVLTNSKVAEIKADKKQIIVNGLCINYDSLILALGGSTKELQNIDADARPYIQSINDLSEFHQFQKKIDKDTSIAVVGGGLIGCEYANDLSAAGYKVTLLCAQDWLLQKNVPKEIGLALAEALNGQGVEVVYNCTINQVSKKASSVELIDKKNNAYKADYVLSAIGLTPRIELAKSAGIEINKGIVVNEYLQTSKADIYALGDCIEINGEPQMYVMPFMHGAKAIAQTLNGSPSKYGTKLIPVQVKTTAFPIAYAGSIDKKQGNWHIVDEKSGYRCEFREKNKKLCAYALTTGQLMHKVGLNKELLSCL